MRGHLDQGPVPLVQARTSIELPTACKTEKVAYELTLGYRRKQSDGS